MADTLLVSVNVIALMEDPVSSSPIVLLHDPQMNRLLPIWIGDPEARAIAVVLNKTSMPRPLTHRLLLNVVEKMGGKLSRVIVDNLERNTYFASIYVSINGRDIAIDGRPSDAISLALEAKAPIFVSKIIMDKAAQKNPFPGVFEQQKRETRLNLTETDLEKMKKLIENAREREEKS